MKFSLASQLLATATFLFMGPELQNHITVSSCKCVIVHMQPLSPSKWDVYIVGAGSGHNHTDSSVVLVLH